ncbi:MAG: Flp pilus assembly protein CpaB [Pseudomonadota bacterium]
MSVRNILLIATALALIVGTIFVARGWLDSQRARPTIVQPVVEEKEVTEVLVARTDLPPGVFINEQHLRWQAWPNDDIPENYYVKTQQASEDLHGSVVRHTIAMGQPVTRSQIIHPGTRGFLAAVLKPGFRATSIKINSATGIAGLVFPGDRVDILLTYKLEVEKETGKKKKETHRASETVLTNVRVLALDSRLASGNEPRAAKTVTLEVTPKQAEVLAVADSLGKLSLSLRSLAKDDEELERLAAGGEPSEEGAPERSGSYTWDAEATTLVAFPPVGNGNTVKVVRGNKIRSQKVEKAAEGDQKFEITVTTEQDDGSSEDE